VLEAVVDDGDTGAIDLEKLDYIARGVFANGDDTMLAMGETADDNAAVEHAFPIIFFGHVARGQVMDGCDQGTWPAPQHAAIAGDMEDVDAMLRGEAREMDLVPENVFDGGAKAFGDGDDLHSAA